MKSRATVEEFWLALIKLPEKYDDAHFLSVSALYAEDNTDDL